VKSELRHFRRHCRSKLRAPVANHQEAFCVSGCHKSFYRHRCIVCERDMPRNAENQRTCYRAECKTAWRQKTISSRFVGDSSAPVKDPLENPIKSGLGGADKYGRRWKFVAGTLSPTAFYCATVPDVLAASGRAVHSSGSKLRTAPLSSRISRRSGQLRTPKSRQMGLQRTRLAGSCKPRRCEMLRHPILRRA